MAVNVTQNNTTVEVSGSQSTIEVNPTTSDIVVSGTGNTSVTIATAGAKGSTGEKGSSGSAGTSGTSGLDGTNFGTAGTSGTSGVDGTSGTSGQDGTLFGSSGTSGVSGTNGTAGSGGTSGTNGTAGSSGTSGITQNLTSLNDFTSSIQTEVDGLSAATSSYLTELPSGTISGSSQITDVITDSYISSSAASSGFGSGGGDSHTHSNKTQLDTINQNLSTTSNVLFNDITASGDVTLSGSLSLNDNEKITFGDSDDMEIFHNGSASYIRDIGTGPLVINSNFFRIKNQADTENMASFFNDGAVSLYYDNDKKFETTADGIAITGSVDVSGSLTLPDGTTSNNYVGIGDADDLKIFHTGNTGIIQNATGQLQLRGNTIRILNAATTEDFAYFNNNGSVDLYYDGTKKFETTADGIAITGSVDVSGSVYLNDGEILYAGDGNDLQIFHSGITGNIKNTTGTLILQSGTIRLQDAGSSETALSTANGIATLYYLNSEVLSTTAAGVAITGSVDISGSLSLNDNEKIIVGDDNDLEIYHNSGNGNTIIQETTGGNLVIRGSNLFLESADYENFFRGIANGAVTLYYDAAAKLDTTADGISMTGRITNLSEPTASQDAATKAYVDASLDGSISGSSQISDLGYVSSSTVDFIQVMTSASYAAITPVSGTLYIIQG